MPESVGGAGLGITEAAIMMQAVVEGGMTAASTIHGPVFSLEPIDLFGTEEQKKRMIPRVLTGAEKMCFVVTSRTPGSTRPSSRHGPNVCRAAIASTAKKSASPTRMFPTRSGGIEHVFITDLFIPERDRIGEEEQGFRIILKG
jgi:acyl-CoA dehydrogenase